MRLHPPGHWQKSGLATPKTRRRRGLGTKQTMTNLQKKKKKKKEHIDG
jgi:hypothetical protein